MQHILGNRYGYLILLKNLKYLPLYMVQGQPKVQKYLFSQYSFIRYGGSTEQVLGILNTKSYYWQDKMPTSFQ